MEAICYVPEVGLNHIDLVPISFLLPTELQLKLNATDHQLDLEMSDSSFSR